MIKIFTHKPIAIDSLDHIEPHGTMRDNSSNPNFNKKLYELIPVNQVRLLDIGCAGGALVRSILDDGGFAVGIEGSDYSKRTGRAEWPALADKNLFTADATEDFTLTNNTSSGIGIFIRFNIVTAWEFMEHIEENKIDEVILNIKRHLFITGFFIGSISPDEYGIWHRTVKSKQWWIEKFDSLGMMHRPDLEEYFAGCMVRPEGFPMALSMK